MPVEIHDFDLHVVNMRTRMPFRYGIAVMTALPHLFVRCTAAIDGVVQQGIAADGLPPRWFTKSAESSFVDEMRDMVQVIRNACDLATGIRSAPDVFSLWQAVYRAQERWAADRAFPPLLWGFGVSLVERALIDAFCRATAVPFGMAVRANSLGIRLGEIHPELAGTRPGDLLPRDPPESVWMRHTVGLADPLIDSDIPEEERLHDSLPQSLQECIRTYGLTHFKLKLCGVPDRDCERLARIAALLEAHALPVCAVTLDGNEQYPDVAAFRAFWESLQKERWIPGFLPHLLFVEQPLRREVALSPEVGKAFQEWPDRPPILIDESDGELHSLPDALRLGYLGTSHKNCKGVFKGIANACLIVQRNRARPENPGILSGEDLANVGPVALLQDLTVMANLGVTHVERNGHHYFAGLSMLPRQMQEEVLRRHGDLYGRHQPGDFAAVQIQNGRSNLRSLLHAPFGVGFLPDLSPLIPLSEWHPESVVS